MNTVDVKTWAKKLFTQAGTRVPPDEKFSPYTKFDYSSYSAMHTLA